MKPCVNCEQEFDDALLENHPHLIHPDDPSEPESLICQSCLPRLEQQANLQFVCNECHLVFNGNRVLMTPFGLFCKTCREKEGFAIPELTPIPENGWTGKDVGREVFIKGEHGVIFKDIIVMSSLRGPDICIGPSTYVAQVFERLTSFAGMQNGNTFDEGLQALLDHLHPDRPEHDDDNSEMIP